MEYLLTLNVILILSWLNNGVFGDVIKNIPVIVLFGLFLCLLAIETIRGNIKKYFCKENIIIGVFVIFAIIVYMFSKVVYLSMYIQGVICFVICYNLLETIKKLDKKFLWFIYAVLAIDLIYVVFCTLSAYQIEPSASRYLAAVSLDDLRNSNSLYSHFGAVGGYGYSYSLPIFILISLHFLLKKKYIAIIPLILFSIALWKSRYSIALIGCVILLGFYIYKLFIEKYFDKRMKLVLLCMFIFSTVIIISNLESIGNFLTGIHLIPKDYSVRILEISNFLKTGNLGGTDLEARLNVYLISVNGIIKNHGLLNFKDVITGGHSTLLDSLSMFGVFCIPLFYYFYISLRNTLKPLIQMNNSIYFSVLLYFFFIALVNPVLIPQIAIALYIILPLSLMLISSKEGKLNYESSTD